MSEAISRRRDTAGRRLLTRLARIDDGVILKSAFFAMLVGTATVLFLDYSELTGAPGPSSDSASTGNPILPSVDRPEVDPDNPAFRPTETVTTAPEVLSAPLDMALISGGVLKLTGTITPGSADRLAQEISARGEYIETVALDSPGGSATDALAMAALIREHGFDTAVGDGALCASSCPLVLAGGVHRLVSDSAAVGVHQVYTSVASASEVPAAQAMSDAQATTARITRHLRAMDIDPALWLHALETPPDRLYYLSPQEMREYGLAAADGSA